jgi:GDSL-like lipase/acylhydrolase family protein
VTIKLILAFVAVSLLIGSAATAQTPTSPLDPTLTTAYQDAVVYAGPGATFLQVNLLRPGIPAQIVERNRIGTWVRVQRSDEDAVVMDGWVISGYLNLDPHLRFSQIPENTDLADGDPEFVDSQSLKQLYSIPVIPTVGDSIQQVYQRGQDLGERSHVITKVGDSLVANPIYLLPMSRNDSVLGAYDYLADTLAYFGPYVTDSAAARIGLSSYVVFDPMWANHSICQTGETPLDCEYRLKRPNIALIMFGPNDVKHMDTDAYSAQMKMIVEDTLNKGIIPVLFTFSYNPDADLWWQSVNFNLALADIADQYQIPLVNLWLAARILPDYGLDKDHTHLKNSGFEYLKFTSGNEAFYGVTLQNLLALRVLDELRRTLNMQ